MNIRRDPWKDPDPPSNHIPQSGFAERLEGYIKSKACGRIVDLRVECGEDTVILTGRTSSYHAKQVAHEAALDLTNGQAVLTNQITVC